MLIYQQFINSTTNKRTTMVNKILCSCIFLVTFFVFSHAQSNQLDFQTKALFGSVKLSEGFQEDSHAVKVVTKTDINIQQLNFCMECQGYLGKVAVVDLKWEGVTDKLRIHFEPKNMGTYASVTILTPNNDWLYTDNKDMLQNGPVLYVYGYNSGDYKIYIGGVEEGGTLAGEIIFTEASSKEEDSLSNAIKLDVPFVATPEGIVDTMLNMAKVTAADYLIDLGSGDGRLVIGAAARGAYGYGMDLNPVRVEEAWENAKKADVLDRVSFMEGNVFDADLRLASVVTMYLSDSINVALRPKIFEHLKPGSRVVSHAFRMGDWQPDLFWKQGCIFIYGWTVPAMVEGRWSWEIKKDDFTIDISQKFQKIEITAYQNGIPLVVHEQVLIGKKIEFIVSNPKNGTRYICSGAVENESIQGSISKLKGGSKKDFIWKAYRKNF